MMNKRIKQGAALVLAAALAFSAFVLPKSYAAKGVEMRTDCAIEVKAPTEFKELSTEPVEIKLYKVATINVQGEYTAVEAFASLQEDLSKVDSGTEAEDWEKMAAAAKALVTKDTKAEDTIYLTNGTATATGLETGLYLVDAKEEPSDTYIYSFNPYLISLPNNYYYSTGNDDWDYSLTGDDAVSLKAEKKDRYGDLLISKTLDKYNATLDGATFVFQVDAFKKDIDKTYAEDDLGEQVYSNVVAISFDNPGTKSVKIEDIPAGATVIVKEIYTGSTYVLTSAEEQRTEIVADKEDGSSADNLATVTFANTHTNDMNGGSGLVNEFTFERSGESGSWRHQSMNGSGE